MTAHAQAFPAIEHATITVARIFPARQQGRSATIKDTDGLSFGIWPDKLASVEEGRTYEVDYTSKVANGVTFRDVKTIRAVERANVAAPPPAQARAVPAAQSATATTGSGNGNGYYRPTSPRDSERMFVCSTLNAFIQTGRIDPVRDHIAAVITELRAAYAATFGRDDGSAS